MHSVSHQFMSTLYKARGISCTLEDLDRCWSSCWEDNSLMLSVRKGPEFVKTMLMSSLSLGPGPAPQASDCIPVLWCSLFKNVIIPIPQMQKPRLTEFKPDAGQGQSWDFQPSHLPCHPCWQSKPLSLPCLFLSMVYACVCVGGGVPPYISSAARSPALLSPQPSTKGSFSPCEACHEAPTSWRCLRGTLFPFGVPSALQPRK